MCLGIPMRIVRIHNLKALCEAKGIEREIDLFLMQHETLAPGDYLITHLGQGIQKISEEEAKAAWAVYDEMLSLGG
ncbi:MAG: hydrogenase assembly protein HypC [Gammaproteobacteria bacterium RIFOXYA12_FULL_61_12]|nr:MAG: hydrogenase assembly protein HypC [Gammaproteobacteria bacterium RIFOXYD12_FULL_61_37]OGT93612.1 MAG: hydrogenase assembly protein HypC [Gammaproteobacteria bacterium RIFOXYA12_FULL_61_12]